MTTYAAGLLLAAVVVFASPHAALASHHGSHVVVPPGQPGSRVGPSYLYPDPETTPSVTNLELTQANIHQTICVPGWTPRFGRQPPTRTP
jgi:hypothetical protein